VTQQYNECGESEFVGETLTEFVLGGSVGANINFETTIDEQEGLESLSGTSTLNGNVTWTSGERSGSCSVALTSTTDLTQQSISATTSGTVCGTQVSETFTYGLGFET